jgi:hypothetical protein
MTVEQKRRMARIPVACPVGIREKSSSWITQTVDVGARGCRITLERPLSRGALVELAFDRGNGAPLQALGQVAWTRASPPRAAGIVFVNLPREPTGAQARNWIDALVATRLRQIHAAWPAENDALGKLGDVAVQLGIPPTEPLDRAEVTLVRLARDGVRLSAVTRSAEALRVLVSLLAREVLSVARETPDPEGWKSAFGRFASWTAAQTPAPRPQR